MNHRSLLEHNLKRITLMKRGTRSIRSMKTTTIRTRITQGAEVMQTQWISKIWRANSTVTVTTTQIKTVTMIATASAVRASMM